ncbi:PREDICTED: uncharacterized protein LOC106749606 [Dinoponera quadriceps]|uniref:Uncharacterized protein LOC106749606 n=1 Tax=Dinoponera quadriceps TaxID=609295 RepID=A0A6P3Y3C5_DINQU|nr:PREDICTED: uncharacterized protein LOC106749606 [Dinoponera quadriceps]
MASATMMGLRRRAPVNNSPTPSSQSPATSGTSSSKRSRSENNNSPSHGNLNSMNGGSRDEPPTKKSRGTSTSGAKATSGCPSTSLASSATCSTSSAASSITSTPAADSQSSRSRGTSVSRSATQTKSSSTSTAATSADISSSSSVLSTNSWPTTSDVASYASGLGLTGGQTAGLCAGSLGMPPTPISYMSTSMATFVGNATNLGKSSSVSYLDISNMTGGSLASGGANSLNGGYPDGAKNGMAMPYSGMPNNNNGSGAASYGGGVQKGPNGADGNPSTRKFLNDTMFTTYQPWVIKTYGDLAKTKTITIKKYARILRTLRGEEVNSAENSKFRFWVKSKGFHIGQPEGYDAKPADRIIGRHAVTSPGLDPPLYVPTQPPHNKALNGAEGTVPPGRVYKKVAIVENFFDIIHAVHVDLEGRPGKHAGQKRTYRTITETYAFLPREAVTKFLLGCTECQRRPRTPSPTNLSGQTQSKTSTTTLTSTATSTVTPLSPVLTAGGNTTALTATASSSSAASVQSSPKIRDGNNQHAASSEGKNLHSYRHQKQHRLSIAIEKIEKEKEEKYNPLSITNLLKKEPVNGGFLPSTDTLPDSRRTPESDRASSKSSASSKRKRMLPEGRTPSPQPNQPLPRPWSPGLDTKNTPIDYSRPITTSYLKHQQRILQAEKSKATAAAMASALLNPVESDPRFTATPLADEMENAERERFSPATGLIDTNLNLLATIQHLHCQVMLALTERLRPSIAVPSPLVLPPTPTSVLTAGPLMIGTEVSVQTGENHS